MSNKDLDQQRRESLAPLKGESKTSRIPIKIKPKAEPLKKPRWIKAKAPTSAEVTRLKGILREQ